MTRHKTQGIIFDYKIAAKSGYLVSRMYIMILGSKGLLPPTRCLRIAPLQSNSRNSINIRNPHIYCVNSYFLMFSGSQVQMFYLASKNDTLTFVPWHSHMIVTYFFLKNAKKISQKATPFSSRKLPALFF